MSETEETAANIGREVGAMVRAGIAGQTVDQAAIYDGVNQMLEVGGDTPADALALLTMARTLRYGHPSRRWLVPWSMSPEDALIVQLLDRAVEALERATGERESTFSGFDMNLN